MKSERSMEAPVTSDKVLSPKIADRGPALCFISIFAAALIVRMHGLGFNPYWMDEVTTLQRANYPLPKLLSDSLTFHHLPTYFLLISWLVPFDLHETLIRAPSALFGALTCAIGADISRLLGGMSAALTTGIFLALSPLQVAYGQEARPHALSVLLVAVALRGLIGLALDPTKASLRLSSPEANRIAWATFFFGTLAAVNVLGVALIWAAAAFIALLIIAYHPGCDRPQLLRNALVVLGNHLARTTTYSMSDAQESAVLQALEQFLLDEPDEMLREHAIWASEQSQKSHTATILQRVKD